MTKLSEEARFRLDLAGISVAEWTRRFAGDGAWGGDKCGCPDDRCIGYHHEAAEGCGCLDSLVREYRTEQQADADAEHVWEQYQAGRKSNDTAAVEQALAAAEEWVSKYQGVSVTSWSLDELVGGRAGISITNSINDQRWLVWAADSTT